MLRQVAAQGLARTVKIGRVLCRAASKSLVMLVRVYD
jgi:hypothetical protein